MKVLDLLEEIEDIVDTSSGIPLSNKIVVEADELLAIVRDIRTALPEEIHQAQWIKNEQQRILTEAKDEYKKVIEDARKQADTLVNNHDITIKAKIMAEDILNETEEKCRQLKLGAYEYVDNVLYEFQTKMEQLNGTYLVDMYKYLEAVFAEVNDTLEGNRESIRIMAADVQAEQMEKGTIPDSDERLKSFGIYEPEKEAAKFNAVEFSRDEYSSPEEAFADPGLDLDYDDRF